MRMRTGPGLSSVALVMSVASLTACGGGGGGGGSSAPPPAPTYTVNGTVSGLANGAQLVLAVAGRSDVTTTSNGNLALASGLASGASYTVTVKTQPPLHDCSVANGTGTIAGANVTNITVTCTEQVSLSIGAPANGAWVAENTDQEVIVNFSAMTGAQLTYTVLPAGLAANATVTPVSSADRTATVAFKASALGDYTLRVGSQVDPAMTADVAIKVHRGYSEIAGKSQRRVYLQNDGRIRSDEAGAPTGPALHVAFGYRSGIAVMEDGTVQTWGLAVSAPTPSGLTGIKAVANGAYFFMAQKSDDTLAVWGKLNVDAVLAPGMVGVKVIDFDTTLATMVAILEDGTLKAWDGEFGSVETLPTEWQSLKFKKVCGAQWHIVALDEAGGVHSWNPTNANNPGMDTVPTTSGPVANVFCGGSQGGLVQEDGRVITWGDDLGSEGAFDSNASPGFPRIKDIGFYDFGSPEFLTEGGAVIDREGNLVTDINDL